MIGHVAAQRRHGNVAFLHRVVVSAFDRVYVEILFADPKVRFAAWIDVFGDHGPRILDALSCDFHAFDLAGRQIDVEQRAFRQSFFKHFARRDDGESGGFFEIEVVTGDEAQRETGNTEDRCFERSGDGARIGRVVTEVAAVIDTRDADVRTFYFRQDLVERERDAIGGRAVDGPVAIVELADTQRARERQAV